jgi:hypothetical protein
LKDGLSTRNILRRKNRALSSYDYVLCQLQLEETLEHLFLSCPFAISCWNLLHLTIPAGHPFQVLQSFKTQLNASFFMDVIIIRSGQFGWPEMTSYLEALTRLYKQLRKDKRRNLP